MKLYEIAAEYKNLEELIDGVDLPQELIKQALSVVEGSLQDKLEGICKYIKTIESDVEGIKGEVARLSSLKKSKENVIASIKTYMFDTLKSLDMEKVKTTLFNVSIAKNPASVNVIDESLVLDSYKVAPPLVLDKKSILEDLKAGLTVTGCEIKQGESLRIK